MEKKPNYFDLNTREKRIYRARKKLGDEFFLDFFEVMRDYQDTLAMKFVIEGIDEGESLDEIFYTGGEFGYNLSTRDEEENSIVIDFGCQAGPLAGDGNWYFIQFEEDGSYVIDFGGGWIS
jgi:hypothetical protein